MTQAEMEVEIYRAAVRIHAAKIIVGRQPHDLASCVKDAMALLEKTEAILAGQVVDGPTMTQAVPATVVPATPAIPASQPAGGKK